MSEPLLIGVDVGTTSTKAALFDAGGRALGGHRVATWLHEPERGHVEQDPLELERSVHAAVAGAVAAAGAEPGAVAALAIGGQMAGVMGVDAALEPTTSYDSWLDARSAPQLERIAAAHGERIVRLTGCPPMLDHAPKLVRRREQEPEAFAATARWLVPGAWIAARLCGLSAAEAFVDRTYVHFSGVVDAGAGAWSPELCEAVGVPLGTLPRIVEPTAVAGALTLAAAAATGLRPGTPVAAGLGDTAASLLGAGVVAPGQLMDSAGTAACLCASADAFRPDVDERTLIAMRGAVPGQWISLAYLAGGSLLPWLAGLLGDAADAGLAEAAAFERVTALAAQAAPGAGGLLFVPHLDGRILPSDPHLRGAWVGLRRDHGRGELCRAALESAAFEYRDYLRVFTSLHPELEPRELRGAGGGARSGWWNGVKASCLGLPYATLDRDELGCWGAALVAGAAVGLFDDLAEAAARTTAVRAETLPDPDEHERYRRMAPVHRQLTEALAGPCRQLDALGMTPMEDTR